MVNPQELSMALSNLSSGKQRGRGTCRGEDALVRILPSERAPLPGAQT